MRLEHLVMFFLGIVLVVVGAGLLLWVSVQKRAHAGAVADAGSLFDKLAKLFDSMGNYFGPDPAARYGGLMVVAGLGLVAASFLI